MPLSPIALKAKLEESWIVPEGGSYPQSAQESGDRFAAAAASWFAGATAMGLPCSTAQARQSQLASQAASALEAGSAALAGHLLALAFASYCAGQSFGAGVASFPTAMPAGAAQIGAAFADLQAPRSSRAQEIAGACHLIALSTLVVFTSPPSSSPIT